jgi:hypothetical protein
MKNKIHLSEKHQNHPGNRDKSPADFKPGEFFFEKND